MVHAEHQCLLKVLDNTISPMGARLIETVGRHAIKGRKPD